MKTAILVALVSIGILSVSCKKDKDDDDNNPTSAEILTSAAWSIDTIAFDTDKNGEMDTPIPGGFDDCDLDNTLTFSADSTGVFNEGALKCDPNDPQTIPITWSLKENDKVINITGDLPGELNGDVKILELTETSFVMSKNINIVTPFPTNTDLIIALKR
jgi:hypothetical protein